MFILILTENFVYFNSNWVFRKVSSILISEIKQILMLQLINSLNEVNLFLTEFMFRWFIYNNVFRIL